MLALLLISLSRFCFHLAFGCLFAISYCFSFPCSYSLSLSLFSIHLVWCGLLFIHTHTHNDTQRKKTNTYQKTSMRTRIRKDARACNCVCSLCACVRVYTYVYVYRVSLFFSRSFYYAVMVTSVLVRILGTLSSSVCWKLTRFYRVMLRPSLCVFGMP